MNRRAARLLYRLAFWVIVGWLAGTKPFGEFGEENVQAGHDNQTEQRTGEHTSSRSRTDGPITQRPRARCHT